MYDISLFHPFDAVWTLDSLKTPSSRLKIPVLGEPTTHGEPFGSIEIKNKIKASKSPNFFSAAHGSRTRGLPNHFPHEGVGAPYNPGPMCSV